jgi:hypothetical protein
MRIVAPILFVFAAAAKGTFRDDHSVTWFIADLQISKSPIGPTKKSGEAL